MTRRSYSQDVLDAVRFVSVISRITQFCSMVGTVVVLLSIVIGLIAAINREMFLVIPEVGIYAWALTGGRMPPLLEYTSLSEPDKWLQDGDVVLSTSPKSGSMWLSTIVLGLRLGGWNEFEHLEDYLGSLEFLRHPRDTQALRYARNLPKRQMLQEKHNVTTMQWLSHCEYDGTPATIAMDVKAHPNVKYIPMVRNGKEVVRSFYNFFNSFTQDVRNLWGGFPPAVSKEDALKLITVDQPDFYFHSVQRWWAVKDEPNVHLVHFADLKKKCVRVCGLVARSLVRSLIPFLVCTHAWIRWNGPCLRQFFAHGMCVWYAYASRHILRVRRSSFPAYATLTLGRLTPFYMVFVRVGGRFASNNNSTPATHHQSASTRRVIEEIAEFLEIDASEELINRVLEITSLEYMSHPSHVANWTVTVRLSVRLSPCMPACLPAYLPACLPDWLPACLPACLAACLPACLRACLPACLPVSLTG